MAATSVHAKQSWPCTLVSIDILYTKTRRFSCLFVCALQAWLTHNCRLWHGHVDLSQSKWSPEFDLLLYPYRRRRFTKGLRFRLVCVWRFAKKKVKKWGGRRTWSWYCCWARKTERKRTWVFCRARILASTYLNRGKHKQQQVRYAAVRLSRPFFLGVWVFPMLLLLKS